MTTVSASILLFKTETRDREQLLAVRNAHKDVVDLSHVRKKVDRGESLSIEASKFMYLYMRDIVDEVSITAGTPSVITNLTNVSGMIAFPFACTITINVPVDASNILPRHIEMIYS